jgi:hypothetical protein
MTVISRCPSCDGALLESDVVCDMHISGCGCAFPTAWIPEVDYDQEALAEEAQR